jgi:MarR family
MARATTIASAGEAVREAQLAQVAAEWARIGVWLSVAPAADPVDVEALIARTAHVARDDERVFVGAASWLAAYHGWVNGRRLARVMTALSRSDPTASAVAGALLTLAAAHATGPANHPAPELEGAIDACRPLSRPRPLFEVVERFPSLRADAKAGASLLYRRWGLWHDDEEIKLTAIRPGHWLLRHVPELCVRALLGPSLEADLVALALAGPVTARDVGRVTGVSYAAAHGAADRLVARGLIRRERAGVRQFLQLTDVATSWLGRPGGTGRSVA